MVRRDDDDDDDLSYICLLPFVLNSLAAFPRRKKSKSESGKKKKKKSDTKLRISLYTQQLIDNE